MAINGLKDEIEKERKVCEQLKKVNANLSENLEVSCILVYINGAICSFQLRSYILFNLLNC